MTEENKPKEEVKDKPTYIISSPNNAEFCKIGELQMASEVLNAKELLSLILGALQNKEVQEYLQVVEKRKQGGTYIG